MLFARSANLSELRDRVSARIEKNQQKDKQRFDRRRLPPKRYNDGDLVMVKRTDSLSTGSSRKLHPIFKGPFKVIKVLANDRYRVQNLRDSNECQTTVAVDSIKPWITMTAPDDQPLEM